MQRYNLIVNFPPRNNFLALLFISATVAPNKAESKEFTNPQKSSLILTEELTIRITENTVCSF